MVVDLSFERRTVYKQYTELKNKISCLRVESSISSTDDDGRLPTANGEERTPQGST